VNGLSEWSAVSRTGSPVSPGVAEQLGLHGFDLGRDEGVNGFAGASLTQARVERLPRIMLRGRGHAGLPFCAAAKLRTTTCLCNGLRAAPDPVP